MENENIQFPLFLKVPALPDGFPMRLAVNQIVFYAPFDTRGTDDVNRTLILMSDGTRVETTLSAMDIDEALK